MEIDHVDGLIGEIESIGDEDFIGHPVFASWRAMNN